MGGRDELRDSQEGRWRVVLEIYDLAMARRDDLDRGPQQ